MRSVDSVISYGCIAASVSPLFRIKQSPPFAERDLFVHLSNIKTASAAFSADAVQKFHSAIAINSRIFISTAAETMRLSRAIRRANTTALEKKKKTNCDIFTVTNCADLY